jgi:hypothetical protein
MRCSQVEKQEHLLGAQVVDDRVDRGLPGLLLDAQGAADLPNDEPGVDDGRELDQPDTVAVAIGEVRRSPQHQAGLPGASHAHQGDQATGGQQAPHIRQLPLASHERGDLEREVRQKYSRRSHRRELATQSRRRELVDVLGSIQVTQPMVALVDQLSVRGQPVRNEARRHPRDEHLAAVPDCPQTGDPVEGRTKVVAIP